MKRWIAILALLSLLGVACGGDAPERAEGDDEVAETEDSKDSERDSDKSAKKSDKEGRGPEKDKKRPRKKGDDAAPDEKGNDRETGNDADSDATTESDTGNSDDEDVFDDDDGNDDEPPATAARPPTPIPAGEHAYTTEGRRSVSGNSEEFPETTTLVTTPPDDGLQRQTRDLRDDEGHGTVTETHLTYRSDGVYLSYVKVTSSFPGGFTDVREFRLPQPKLIAPIDAGPGYRQSFVMQGSGTRAEVSIAARRWEAVSVSGSNIRALVVESRIVFSGALDGEQKSVSWFWPKHLWVLKEQVHTDVTNGPIRLQSDYSAVLRDV